VNQLSARGDEGEHGLVIEYFNSSDLSGDPVWTTLSRTTELFWLGSLPTHVNPKQFSVRATGHFTPEETGVYVFGLVSAGVSRLSINGQEVIDNWNQQQPGDTFFGLASAEATYTVKLAAGETYTLVLEYSKGSVPLSAVRLGCLPPLPVDALERAAALAGASDVALVFAGLSGEWECEGFDRPGLELVGQQVALIEKVAAANKNTVVILNTGSPIEMPWLDRVAAVVQAWYPGQECGHAIADVLFGDVNPSGKLTQTFPVRIEDNPAYINYPGENDQVHYGEGIFVGYRYYEKKKVRPLFPFGFGLSYTTFIYDTLSLSTQEIGPDDTLRVSVNVTNAGARAGQEVVQVYIQDKASSLQRPNKELKAFTKVRLAAGERRSVTFTIARDSLAYYDNLARTWIAEAGEFEVLVGSSSQDIHATSTFVFTASSRFGGPAPKDHTLPGMHSSLAQLLENDTTRAVLIRYLPALADSPQASIIMSWRLEQIANVAPAMLTSDVLLCITRDLEQLES
jgi:beta-glucosidase